MAYFLPRNNRVYSALIAMSSFYRYLTTVLVLIVFIYVWLHLLYYPSSALAHHYQAEVAALKAQQEKARQLRPANNSVAHSIERAQQELRPYLVSELPAAQSKKQLMTLMALGAKAGLIMKSCVVDAERDYDYYAQDIVSMDFSGSLDQIQSFFQQLKTSKLLVSHESITLATHGENMFQFSCTLACVALKPLQTSAVV